MSVAEAYPKLIPYPEKRITPARVWAWFCYLAWQLFSKPPLFLVYIGVTSKGMRILMPGLAQKCWKIPALGFLKDYELTHRIDLSHLFCVFLAIAAFALWARVIEIWLEHRESDSAESLVLLLAGIILVADGILFFLGVTSLSWGSSKFNLSAVVATACWLAVLVFCIFVSVTLKQKIRKERDS